MLAPRQNSISGQAPYPIVSFQTAAQVVTTNVLLLVKSNSGQSSIMAYQFLCWQHFCSSLDAVLALHVGNDCTAEELDCAIDVADKIGHLRVIRCAYFPQGYQ